MLMLSFGERFLDLKAIRSLLWEELSDWRRDMDKTPITEEQDLRAFFIEWIAAFLPEIVVCEFVKELRFVAEKCRAASNYQTHGWHRILPIDVALFLLEGGK